MRTLLRLALPALIVTAMLFPGTASADVAWGPQRVIKDWSWSSGSSLVVTGSGSSATLFQLASTDFVGGEFATDHGPYEGVFLTSSDDRGQTWSGLTRVSQPKRHADRGALASDDSTLYAVWVTRASYDHDSPSSRRILYFRARLGAGGWGPTVRLSKQKGRVDFPSVAAAAGRVYVVWTDANTGDVRLAVSADDGQSWKRSVLGKAKATDVGGEGHVGVPSVGAANANVGVSWLATSAGAVRAVVSTNGGRKWRPAVGLVPTGGAANGGSPTVAAAGDRLAFGWTTPSGVWSRVWSGGSWGAAARVAALGGGATYRGAYDAQISLTAGVVGMAWSGCISGTCDTASAQTRTQLLWSGSTDGSSWEAPSLVRGSKAADQRINDGASVAWLDPQTRVVTYAGAVSGLTSYRLYARIGNRTP